MTAPLLGFGTASVLGSRDRRTSERAIRSALASGIRHFDTARSYGWGEAEAVLGRMIRDVPREELVIASKCGLLPVRQSSALGLAKATARRLVTWFPFLKTGVRRMAATASVQPSSSYDLATLQASFRTSLDNLGTPYLDVLLLHNFEPGKPGLEPVVGWMRQLLAERQIRAHGFSIEGNLVEGLDWLARHDMLDGAVIQTPLVDALMRLPARFETVDFIVHSPFRYLQRQAATRPGLTFADLLLEIRGRFRCRAVVCSMFDDRHRQHNIAAAAAAFG